MKSEPARTLRSLSACQSLDASTKFPFMRIDYRSILNEIFVERTAANASYSLRSYARDLKVSPSTLSEVLNGKKGLSPKLASSIAQNLKLPDWEKNYFCDLVTKDHAKSPRIRSEAKRRLEERKKENHVHILNQRALKALTSWVDLAILELTYMPDFESSNSWIANKLQVPVTVISSSLTRLIEAGLLEINKDTGRWSDVSPLFSSTDGIPNESIRNFHKTVLNLALKKLESPDVKSRTVKSVIFSVSSENVPKAQQILNDAIAQLVSLADNSDQQRDEVLCFSGQLFSLLNKGN
ncbi:TIGR02147 family protein [Bdellovibrio sp. HCB274]|uniref:TIGR02147 family protein n=1 Tax=Bdellovibrio sp. HCB274 TaxID=3394361 RepID=UPI0039B49919